MRSRLPRKGAGSCRIPAIGPSRRRARAPLGSPAAKLPPPRRQAEGRWVSASPGPSDPRLGRSPARTQSRERGSAQTDAGGAQVVFLLEVHTEPGKYSRVKHRVDEDKTVSALPARGAEQVCVAVEQTSKRAGHGLNLTSNERAIRQ